ncbi:MAG: RNA polymerase sigma factor [Saprospiraceae bacterium]
MIDPHVIQLCLAGKPKGHELLYRSSAPYAFSIARRYLESQEDCKDAMQESYANVFSKIKQYDAEKGPFKFWLRRIVVNCCLKHRQKRKAFLTVEGEIAEDPIDSSYLESLQLSREEVQRLLQEMPDRYRLVFMLSIMDEYTHKEIADKLSISPETSRSQLTRAKQWLRKHLTGSTKWEQYGLL